MIATVSPRDPAIRIVGLKKRFGDLTVLDDVSFDVAAGEVVAILGASGAGKTTLFRCLTRLAQCDCGQIFLGEHAMRTLGGRELSIARSEVGLIFQQFNLIRRLSALDNVLAGRLGEVPTWRVMLQWFPQRDRQLALASLDRVGMLPYALQRYGAPWRTRLCAKRSRATAAYAAAVLAGGSNAPPPRSRPR